MTDRECWCMRFIDNKWMSRPVSCVLIKKYGMYPGKLDFLKTSCEKHFFRFYALRSFGSGYLVRRCLMFMHTGINNSLDMCKGNL